MQEIRFSTDALPVAERFDAWRGALSAIWGAIEIEPSNHAPFGGRILSRRKGGLVFNTVSYRGHSLIRTRRNLAAMADQFFVLSRPLRGPWRISTDRDDLQLSSGNLYLLSNGIPYRSHDQDGYDTSNVMIPAARLLRRLPRLRQTYQFSLAAGGKAALVAAFSDQVAASLADCNEAEADYLGDQLLDLLAILLLRPEAGSEAEDGSVRAAHSARILAHIRRHPQADLSPAMVAAAMGISVRYLHQVLQPTGRSLGDHVLEARLECCRRDLRDPLQSGRSITDIAFAAGFNHAGHFSRAFRRRYGLNPTDFRRRED